MLVYKDAGWLGDGIANSHFVSGVGTNMVSIVFAGAYMAGIRDFDVQQAMQQPGKMNWNGKIARVEQANWMWIVFSNMVM